MRHIPAGMENFTARNHRGWKTIQRTIDDSDYYILILAGRYGSIEPEWKQSWTHHEYEYAVSQNIPVLAFVRDLNCIPGDRLDSDRSGIDAFRSLVQRNLLCSSWRHKEDLASAVSTAITGQISDDSDDGQSRPGWYRGNALPGPSVEITDELARLSAENARLRQEIDVARKMANGGGRNAEIEKVAAYLLSKELEPNVSLYDVFVVLSDNLALGIDDFSVDAFLQFHTQIQLSRRTSFGIVSQLRLANLIKIEQVQTGTGAHQRTEKNLFLTDFGAAVALDARIRKVQLNQKLTTPRPRVYARGRLREASPTEMASLAEPTEDAHSPEPPNDEKANTP